MTRKKIRGLKYSMCWGQIHSGLFKSDQVK